MRFESAKPVFSELKGYPAGRKIKSGGSLTGLFPALVSGAAATAAFVVVAGRGAPWAAAFLLAVLSGFAYVAWRRSGAPLYIASASFLLAAALSAAAAPGGPFGFGGRGFLILFVPPALLPLVVLLHLALTRRARWRGRDVIGLAVRATREEDGIPAGWSGHPGKTDYSWDEIVGFARFCGRRMISLPCIEPEKVYLVPLVPGREFGYLWNVSRKIGRDTWVCFDSRGDVTASISRSDCRLLGSDTPSDRLRESLAGVYLDFLELYARGLEDRVTDRLNYAGTRNLQVTDS